MIRSHLLGAVIVLAVSTSAPLAGQGAPSVGLVSFANSGAPAAQPAFLRGLALLHDFEYDRAAAEFRQAETADAGFAMAYWGEAMTFNHPVWMQQDLPAARAALAKLAASPEARAARAGTARERAYLGAVEILYGDGSKEDRDQRYAAAMAALHEKYPDDVDGTALLALAILGTAHAGRDFATYMRAAALLEEVFPTHQQHPGVVHYLIHCYDDPVHAPLGLRAARLYGALAPDAGHALHMTSHIFLALGMWDDVIKANRQAIAVVNAQLHFNVACGHYPSWLVYADLQQRNFTEARHYIDGCRQSALAELKGHVPGGSDPDSSRTSSFFAMRQMLAAVTGEWNPADDVPLETASDWQRFADAYGALIGANARHDRVKIESASADLNRLAPLLLQALDASHDPDLATRAALKATALQGTALVKLRGGDTAGGLAGLEEAAAIEAAAPIEFGPPNVAKPSFELLGDELLMLGRKDAAAGAYTSQLARTPGRTLTVDGLARARAGAGR
jgi:hypothetical protein